ncbi:acyltransferase [Acidisphaera sp. L21]|uniref:acyltransferase family protein n=1 Tax=Acidisphaera sp. L21 TaxID=1641851 RepID=UPI002110B9D0|nr:acyltransferase [Acidisphaera sp. L21]
MFRPAPVTGRENNFGAIRLIAALLVIYGHGEDMRGLATPILWSRPVAQIGLDLFFCVSGYLIYDSWLRDQRLNHFLAKRALRILPGLAVCVVFCIAVIGAADTALPLGRYFRHHGTWQFLLNIAFYLKLYLPGVFTHRLLGGAVNGSLWSLLPEVLCYLAVPLICLAPGRLRGAVLLVVAVVCGGGGLYMFAYHPTGYSLIYSADPKYVLVEVPFFMAGAIWRQVRVRVPALLRLDIAVLMCVATFALPVAIGSYSVPLRWFTLSYTIIAFGEASTPGLRDALRYGDLSYGAYLYAFPIQQLALEYGDSLVLPTIVTFAIAFLSWHLVEQPALRLKPRGVQQFETSLPSAVEKDGIDWLGATWRLATQTPLLPGVAAFTCLAMFAARLGTGNWHEGEYVLFGDLRVGDWASALPALMAYPVRGLLLVLYGLTAMAAQTTGLVSALLVLWLGALGGAVLAAWFAMPGRPALAGSLALAPFAFILAVTGAIDGPTAAAGVLPTVAAMTALWFFVGKAPVAWCGVVLTIAAGSSVAGAGLAVGVVVGLLLIGWPGYQAALWLVLPSLLGALVLAHGLLDHAVATWPILFAQPGALILFAVGFAVVPWNMGVAAIRPRDMAALASGLTAATLAAVVAGEVTLAPLALALLLALAVRSMTPFLSARGWWWAPAGLALAFYPAALTPAALSQQDAQMAVSARSRTWASARRPGEAMEFYLSPAETSLFGLPPGTYTDAGPLAPISRVFGKSTITVCNAWQQSESWLIDGRFIPSCPPHEGPPDRVANTRP